ncbi:hypothetical protein PsorP6_018879 [Peronosclerospora sorghi]|nr:hypothetical protein PsorP6_018879 [Peronosclerospora sorghi]
MLPLQSPPVHQAPSSVFVMMVSLFFQSPTLIVFHRVQQLLVMYTPVAVSLLALFHPRVNTANARSGQWSNSIVGLLIMGILGSFALHQMMSPEIEAITQQCERLKNDVLLLRLQVEHVTRIAEGRLQTINLIETDLDKYACKRQITPTPGVKHNDIPARVYDGLKDDELGVVLPTIFYTLWVGFVVLAYVMYRVFLIVRGEMITRKLVTKFYASDHGSSGVFMPSVYESSGSGRAGRKTSPSLTDFKS